MQQQQQQRMPMNNIGPMHSYPSIRSRHAPYPYPQALVKTDFNSNAYMLNSSISNRTRTIPYTNSSMYYPPTSQQSMYYPSYSIKSKPDESYLSSTAYYPTVSSNSFIPAQQLPPIGQDYQSQIFPSPSSNPSTPYQGEYTDFGVPYNHGQPSSVNSLTDALCPNGEIIDRQTTPGPPSVGTPRVASHQYSFPHTPSTPRLSAEHNIDELTAFLQDPMNLSLTEDLASTLIEDIEVLANTYLGIRTTDQSSTSQTSSDNDLDYDIILNYLCSDDLISTGCTK